LKLFKQFFINQYKGHRLTGSVELDHSCAHNSIYLMILFFTYDTSTNKVAESEVFLSIEKPGVRPSTSRNKGVLDDSFAQGI